MCDATAFAKLALGGQAAGAAMSTVGAYYSAVGQRNALSSQANIADTNARISELGAQDALLQGQKREQATRLDTAQRKSAQRVAMAANGIALDSDTAVNILTSTDLIGELNADEVAADAARAAFGYRTEAVNQKNAAISARAGAKSINPLMSAGSTFLTGASDVGKSFYTMRKEGLLGDTPKKVK